ncbi:MAG: hypothetical protein KAI79_20175, partial [Bacteroidales bacterium]|nr:hypothetical protein [Bacteroidales bacterium]
LDFKVDKWVWFGFLWTMVTMGSGTAFAFIAIVLLKFVKLKNLIALFIIFGLMIFLANIFGITAFERTFKVFIATLTFDTEVIIEADHSAAFRIVPLLLLAQRVGVTTLDDWFGHGIDYVGSFLSSIMLGLPEGYTGGGLFQLWMDYGFLSFILFIIFSFSHSFRKGDYISMAFWFMLVFIYNINNQIVWITIVLLFTNQYYNKQLSKSTKRFLNK